MKLTFNGKYDCKLSTMALIQIEEELKTNPLNMLMDDEMPELKTLTTILYYAMRACDHSLKKNDMYDILDEYFEGEGNDFTSLFMFINDLYRESGLIKMNDEAIPSTEGEDSKN